MFFFHESNHQYYVNREFASRSYIKPNFCEFEHQYSNFSDEESFVNNSNHPSEVITFRCTNCNKFIAIEYNIMTGKPIDYDYNFIKPDFPFDLKVKEFLNKTSKRFIECYNQASMVEKMGLNELDKMSYRKATEILINDYLKYNNHSDEELFKKTMSDKINMLPDNNLFENVIPRLISWIGNDGAHPYDRKPEFNLQDMKNLIYSLVNCLTVLDINESYPQKINRSN